MNRADHTLYAARGRSLRKPRPRPADKKSQGTRVLSDSETPGYDYPELVHTALVAVVREVMSRAAATGLPGNHHFYLTFGTREPGVGLPAGSPGSIRRR